jgi:hypothetical protein
MLTHARGGGVVVTSGAETQAVLDELSSEIEPLGACAAVFQGGDADGSSPVRAGVGDYQAALRD